METLTWGLAEAVPDGATSAWGCRAVVNRDGMVDLVHDRQDWNGTPDVLEALAEEFPLSEVVTVVGELLRAGDMDAEEPFVLYQSEQTGGLIVVALTRGEYCHLAAWLGC